MSVLEPIQKGLPPSVIVCICVDSTLAERTIAHTHPRYLFIYLRVAQELVER